MTSTNPVPFNMAESPDFDVQTWKINKSDKMDHGGYFTWFDVPKNSQTNELQLGDHEISKKWPSKSEKPGKFQIQISLDAEQDKTFIAKIKEIEAHMIGVVALESKDVVGKLLTETQVRSKWVSALKSNDFGDFFNVTVGTEPGKTSFSVVEDHSTDGDVAHEATHEDLREGDVISPVMKFKGIWTSAVGIGMYITFPFINRMRKAVTTRKRSKRFKQRVVSVHDVAPVDTTRSPDPTGKRKRDDIVTDTNKRPATGSVPWRLGDVEN